ncbi:LysR substrate-binding domain-containing protein [Primorskyibacter sp. S87]|uniref:LysR substrate-binding domain-containing protein n=1 Tax=Primorskyibacter sp. S87 TaxID=3415126 RepID=UPI003C79C19E
MKFKLRQLEAFRAVAQAGSVTGAAAELGVSQPAVSRLLADFSKSVDLPLFRRESGNLIPTAEAEYMLAEIGRVFDSLNHLEDLRHNLKKRTAGHLRIACLPGFATSHLPDALTDFLKDRPQVTVTLEPDRPERILEWIIGQQYDCGITDGFNGHPAIESTDVPIGTVCIMPAGHRLAGRASIEPGDLKDEKLIHSRRDSPFFRHLQAAFTDHDVQMNSWIEVRQFTAACTIVSKGHGVSVVSALDAEQFRDRGIVIRPFEPQIVHRLSLLRPIAGNNSPLVLDFLRHFSDSLTPFAPQRA